jgi:hypothetical protein
MTLSTYEIVQLRCLLDAWDSSPTGSAGSVTDFSSIERPPYPSPGTSPWLLDTGASFHMTHNSSLLTSIRPVDPPVHVLTEGFRSIVNQKNSYEYEQESQDLI